MEWSMDGMDDSKNDISLLIFMRDVNASKAPDLSLWLLCVLVWTCTMDHKQGGQ